MPVKTDVAVIFRLKRADGAAEELRGSGALHRMATAWAVTCRMAQPVGEAEHGVSDMTLIIRPDEIRMNRRGAVAQEQVYRIGERREGTLGTVYGTIAAEARTHLIDIDLSASGGTVVWEYDLRIMDEPLGRCSITLDIREEHTP